jgi:hypothetical protein
MLLDGHQYVLEFARVLGQRGLAGIVGDREAESAEALGPLRDSALRGRGERYEERWRVTVRPQEPTLASN